MTKIVINTCYGGFGLSNEALRLYAKLTGYSYKTVVYYSEPVVEIYNNDNQKVNDWNINRDDPALVNVVEMLGELANNKYSDLKVVEIPNNITWEIGEYDGSEWVQEVHRRWS